MSGEQMSRILVHDDVEHESFAQYMRSNGWRLEATDKTGREGSQSIEEVWLNPTQTIAVHYLDNPRMMARSLWIRGYDIWPVVSDLSACFTGGPPEELLQNVADAQTVRELVKAIFRVAVVYKDAFDQTVFDMLSYYANDEDTPVRRAVVQALVYTEWSESRPLLEKIAKDDPVPDVRAFATEVLRVVYRA